MALTLNGSSNTIGGVAVGGLPDGIVDTDMIAAEAVTKTKHAPGSVVQVAQDIDHGEDSGNETSWTQTGRIDLSFPNSVTSGNKVLLTLHVGIGEAYNNAWAQHGLLTIYCATQGNLGDSNLGICGGWVSGNNSAGSDMQYGYQRMSGSLLYTPTTTTPRYYLYRKRIADAFIMVVGSAKHTGANYNSGNTTLVAMEITA